MFAQRLTELMETKGFPSVGAFAEALGFPASTVYKYLRGREPSAEFLAATAERLGASPTWLLLGRGRMLAPVDSVTQQALDLVESLMKSSPPDQMRCLDALDRVARSGSDGALVARRLHDALCSDASVFEGRTLVGLVGRAAAGKPSILADERILSYLMMDADDAPAGGQLYAIHAHGDSMTGADIHSGDLLLVRYQETAEDGDLVVALIDEHEAVIKRFRRDGADVRLVSAHPDYPALQLPSDRVRIQGKVVAIRPTYLQPAPLPPWSAD